MTGTPTIADVLLIVGAPLDVEEREPTTAELDAIEADADLLEAELAVVDAECRLANDPGNQLAAQLWGRASEALHLVQRFDQLTRTTERKAS